MLQSYRSKTIAIAIMSGLAIPYFLESVSAKNRVDPVPKSKIDEHGYAKGFLSPGWSSYRN